MSTHAPQCLLRAALLGLRVRGHELNSVSNSQDLFTLLIVDGDDEFLLNSHHNLDGVERVKT